MNPYTPAVLPRSIVVCDNCAIHHDEEVRRIIVEECGMFLSRLASFFAHKFLGAKLCYIPPYSPDFNPIEEAFSSMKAWLRRHDSRTIQPEARPWLIHQALMAITPEDACEWISNCGYS